MIPTIAISVKLDISSTKNRKGVRTATNSNTPCFASSVGAVGSAKNAVKGIRLKRNSRVRYVLPVMNLIARLVISGLRSVYLVSRDSISKTTNASPASATA